MKQCVWKKGPYCSHKYTIHTLSKLHDVPVGFVPPPLFLRKCIAILAVAKG